MIRLMCKISRFSLPLILAAIIPGVAAEESPKPVVPDDSMARVLKSDWFALAEHLGDASEAGQNQAAQLQAAAWRVKTETRVSATSMWRVLILGGWRDALYRWEDLELEIVLLQSGGGTMWSHMMQRNDSETAEFLDGIADQLPVKETELKPETARAIDDLLKGAKKRLALAKADTAKHGGKPVINAADLSRRLEETHDLLKWQFRLAGDEATTERLLLWCQDAASVWESVNKPANP